MSTTLGRPELEKAVSDNLLAYLQSGKVNTADLSRSLSPKPSQFAEWDMLKQIHFCLHQPVVEFCEGVWDELRRVKTASAQERTTTRGGVQGNINWGQTIQARSRTGFADRSEFVCNTPYSEYDLPENRVLKSLLWRIEQTIDSLRDINQSWRKKQWSDDELDRFQRSYHRNVHVNRMPDGAENQVSARDIQTAMESRRRVYRESARWLKILRKLDRGEYSDSEVQSIFSSTLVVPATEDRLFELYSVFRVIDAFRISQPTLQLQPIQSGGGPIARLEDDATDGFSIDIYHNQKGTLDFYEPLPSGVERDLPRDPSYFRDHVSSKNAFSRVAGRLTETEPQLALYRGRPDIVVEIRRRTGEPAIAVLIGEVKHTAQQDTFKTGIKELVDYWHHGRYNGTRLADPEGPTTLGLIATNGVVASQHAGPCYHVDSSDMSELSEVVNLLEYLAHHQSNDE